MENPAGYLYRVGYNTAKKPKRADLVGDFTDVYERIPWVEPELAPALAGLSEQQRTVIALIHGFEWSLNEVAEMLEISKSTVQTHEQRAMTSTWATSGSTIFAATGRWVVELNEDGDVASEFFKQDGAWVIGTTSS